MGGLKWNEGIKYNPGDIVKFKGRSYKILQGHTSQGDWTPDLVPALWQAIGGAEGSEDEGKDYKKKKSERRSDNEDSGGERKSKDKKKDKKGGKYSEEESGGEGKKDKKKSKSKNKDEVSEEEDEDDYKKEKKDKKDKKSKGESEEEDGGYDEHKKKDKDKSKDKDKEKKGDKEEKKDKEKKSKYHDSEEGHHEHKSVAGSSGHVDIGKVPGVGQAAAKVAGAFASSQAWIEAARKATAEFKQSGPKGPTTWALLEDNKILSDGIRAGEDKNGNPFYVARAYYEGGLQIGRASSNGAFIGFNGREIPLTQYEVLLGDTRAIKWVASTAGAAGIRAVEGGIDHNGKQLLIAQTRYGGEIIPGKAVDWINGALIALGGQEINVKDYNILAYA
ncbi:hypothetical protein FRC02_012285 [Tulasnella sp. 418]|nr:hypothetical protein FRC02_012285 [Tulasnella sp. 418]